MLLKFYILLTLNIYTTKIDFVSKIVTIIIFLNFKDYELISHFKLKYIFHAIQFN
jgi:hypothetical protein